MVDAGGAGFVLFLDALLHVRRRAADAGAARRSPRPAACRRPTSTQAHAEGDGDDLRYEVMYFLDAADDTIPAFKDVWAGIGDSIVVVGGDGIWNCHIHTDDIGAAIEAAIDAGRPRNIRVTDLHEQVAEERWVREAAAVAGPAAAAARDRAGPDRGRGRRDRARHRAHLLLARRAADRGRRPVDEPVDGAAARGGRGGPGRRGRHPARTTRTSSRCPSRSTAQTAKTVRVVPTKGITEGFAALLGLRPPGRPPSATSAAMTTAAGQVVSGEVTRAVRDAHVGRRPGRDRRLHRARPRRHHVGGDHARPRRPSGCSTPWSPRTTSWSPSSRATAPVRRSPASSTEWLDEHHPDVEAEVHHGGQPLYPYLFGVE